jgi:hypothetical protein
MEIKATILKKLLHLFNQSILRKGKSHLLRRIVCDCGDLFITNGFLAVRLQVSSDDYESYAIPFDALSDLPAKPTFCMEHWEGLGDAEEIPVVAAFNAALNCDQNHYLATSTVDLRDLEDVVAIAKATKAERVQITLTKNPKRSFLILDFSGICGTGLKGNHKAVIATSSSDLMQYSIEEDLPSFLLEERGKEDVTEEGDW